jgi:predicted nucleic acid-binding protein
VNRYLLEVEVLIALIDPAHMCHERTHDWFDQIGRHGWATCPFTENGVLRLIGGAFYPDSPWTPGTVTEMMEILRALGGHEFWPDDPNLFESQHIDCTRLLDLSQVEDTYLLGLACAHGGKLATFNRNMNTSAVVRGSQAVHLIL